MSMKHKTVFDEMNELNRDIMYHANLYFNQDTSEISDFAYDQMVERFDQLAEEHPEIAELFETATKPVPIHEPTNEGLKPVTFDSPMLSLKKGLNQAAVDKWLERFPEDTVFFYELKLDGIALELTYVDGPLISMVTRGSGLVGEDVTHALPLFGLNIPSVLTDLNNVPVPGTVSIRGEGHIANHEFELYNETAAKQAATPRNAVSGWIRALPENQNHAVKGLLRFGAYACSSKLGCKKYSQLRNHLTLLGFHCAPPASLEAIRENLNSKDWPADGIVIKVDDFELQEKLGFTNKYPNWALAYKYPDEEVAATLNDVEWNTTRTGRVVPVGIYTPTRIGGVICSRTLLDNYKQFLALELRKGSVIGVTRNGDVIPRLNRVIEHGDGPLFKAPEECPSCSMPLEKRITKQSADLVCTNVTDCPAQLVLRCVNLAHKRTLDIDDLGPVTIAELVEQGYIKLPVDVLFLSATTVGEKIYNRIQEVRKGQPLYRLIKALGLPGVDLTRAKKLAAAWPGDVNLLKWLSDADNIIKIPGFSAGLSIPIAISFESEDFVKNAEGILSSITAILDQQDNTTELKVCITGTLGQAREDLEDYFGDHGIELVDKLTKDCNYLLIGEKPGRSKVLKATELTIPTINATTATSIDALIQQIKAGALHE